jgi:multidrug resistance efflux pump
MDRTDPYFVLLRRELTRAQARLRRCERERDALRAALEALQAKKLSRKIKMKARVSK